MAGPRYELVTFPQAFGPSDNLALVGFDYRGLLFSQDNYRLPSGAWSGGGSFDTVKTQVLFWGLIKTYLYYDSYEFFDGHAGGIGGVPMSPPSFADWQSSYAPWAENETRIRNSGWYATGYARTRPGNPTADLSQFLIELRDLPRIPFTKGFFKKNSRASKLTSRYTTIPLNQMPRVLLQNLTSFRNLGSEYLNVVFGWKPFVNDLRKMYNLWQTMDKQLAQIQRDNGRNVRRRATVMTQNDTVSSEDFYNFPYALLLSSPLDIMSGTTVHKVSTQTVHDVWYAGSYRYYIPDVGSSQWTSRAKRALFGANLTPELAWEVMPWSWLIDWFSNVGDVMSNFSENAVDNLVCNYSYVMEHTKSVTEHSVHVHHEGYNLDWRYPQVDGTFSATIVNERKSRVGGGNPFGLGVTLESLNPQQLGILAALGISRSKVVP